MHFCVADSRAEADVSFTKLQYKRFMDMLSAMAGVGIRPEIRHCCNSGATILYPEFALDMVRPGIITYGNAPSDELEGALSLRPMMSLHSMIAQVRTVPAGTDISYGRLYRTKEETRVAVLPIGYADGLSRLLTGKASFLSAGASGAGHRADLHGHVHDRRFGRAGDEARRRGHDLRLR